MQKINTALLSFGMSGRVFHAPFIHAHDGFQLVGSWERSTKAIEQHYPGTKSYPTLESVLEDNSVQMVVVNTPTSTHFEYAKKALLAGKHVIVEKAFTTIVAEAKELATLAEKQKLKLAVFQNRRWDSDFKTVQQIVNNGKLGDVIEATISFDRFNPNLSIKQHKETPSAGAGIVKDLGPHVIDQALVLFGMPHAVFADIHTTREHSQVDDYFEILLYYTDKRVRLKGSYFVKEPVPSYIIHGRTGSFLKSRADVQETLLQAGAKPSFDSWAVEPEVEQGLLNYLIEGKTIREKVPTLTGNYMSFFDLVHKSITDNTVIPVTAEDGVRVMQIIETAVKSSAEQRVVDL